jgi:hypothetical protein
MNRSYIRSSDGAEMVEIAPHQYVNRHRTRVVYPNAGHEQGETAVTSAEAPEEVAEAA